jgi:hypothetical protein
LSIAFVNSEIASFLGRPEAEVLCIRGKWGVGKTYGWLARLTEAAKSKKVSRQRYSYVSLFGQDNLQQAKLGVFENTVPIDKADLNADMDSLASLLDPKSGAWRKLPSMLSSLPVVKNWTSSDLASAVSFLSVRDQIVCFDDLERKGKNLRLVDVLGLASYLRERRNCKVVLLLNDEQLEDETKDFERHLEKVIDTSLLYDPSATESAAIALSGNSPVLKTTAARCESLGIRNIRVIRRLDRLARSLGPMLAEYRPIVLEQAVSSTVLFGWSVFQPDEAPSVDYLVGKQPAVVEEIDEIANPTATPKPAAWRALLDVYGYTHTDDFDLALLDGIRAGYFRRGLLAPHAQEAHDRAVAAEADGTFEAAWKLYHDSFDDNQEAVLKAVETSFRKTFGHITPTNLDGTVRLMKDLGKSALAAELIALYVNGRNEDRAFFDLDKHPFGGDIVDPDVRAAFKAKHDSMEVEKDVRAMLLGLKAGWSDDTIRTLADMSIEEYRDILKKEREADLRRILAGTLQFEAITNASDSMREISRRVRAALTMIGAESPINARRVRRYGITVPDPSPQ